MQLTFHVHRSFDFLSCYFLIRGTWTMIAKSYTSITAACILCCRKENAQKQNDFETSARAVPPMKKRQHDLIEPDKKVKVTGNARPVIYTVGELIYHTLL